MRQEPPFEGLFSEKGLDLGTSSSPVYVGGETETGVGEELGHPRRQS